MRGAVEVAIWNCANAIQRLGFVTARKASDHDEIERVAAYLESVAVDLRRAIAAARTPTD